MSRPGYVDKRGSARDRARRRAWLLATFDEDLGPDRARCALKLHRDCLGELDAETLTVDRIEPGGSYRRGNIQPACKPCQDRQGFDLGASVIVGPIVASYRDARDAWEALRESDTVVDVAGGSGAVVSAYQLSDEEFADLFKPPTLREWLIEHGGQSRTQS